MDELTKLRLKYASALEALAGTTAHTADQLFDVKAELTFAQARIAELEKQGQPTTEEIPIT